MPPFELLHPRTVAEAVRLRAAHTESLYLAGGTDVLVNLKHRLHRPTHLVALNGIAELTRIERTDEALHIGAGCSLQQAAGSAREAGLTGLVEALTSIAGPQHREMGTLGGNVLLDTRCLFYNQTEAWRTALGSCLKAEGDWCHVIGSPKACVAAQSSDSVPMLVALGARLHFTTSEGPLERSLSDLFTDDGRYERMLTVPRTALLRSIEVPLHPNTQSTYRKVRARAAVDYPQLSVAVTAAFGQTVTVRIVLGALLPRPRCLEVEVDALDAETIDGLAHRAFKSTKPQTSVHGSSTWRRTLARTETAAALRALQPSRSR